MALTMTNNLTEWDNCDTDNWTGDPSVGLDTDFKIQGTGCIGIDVDIETHRMFGAAQTATDLSNNFIYAWMFSFTASTMDTKVNGGLQICVEDNAGNQSCWYVGGSDNYTGGWEVFSCGTAQTPDWNSGTVATLTSIVKFGVGWKNTAKSKLTQNCFVDWMRYGTGPAFTITGTNTTAGAGWSEIQTLDTAGAYGYTKPIPGGYLLKGPFEFGDSAGTGSVNFTDTSGNSVIFDDQKVGDAHYKISLVGNATGTTDFQLGSVVGTGDDRQGTQGGSISSLIQAWEFDAQTDIADIDTCQVYGARWSGAKAGVKLDGKTTTANSSFISTQFINCYGPETGAISNGAEILSCTIIDPTGTTNNYGLSFTGTPVTGTLTTNVKKISLITSGTPTTQYMTHLPYSGDYTVAYEDIQYFGSYVSATLWHGRNTGTDADVTISATGTTNAAQAQFESTDVTGPDTGSVTVTASVPITITAIDAETSSPVVGASVYAKLVTGDGGAVVMNGETNASGVYSTTYGGTTPVSLDTAISEVRSGSGAIPYNNFTLGGDITSAGYTQTALMSED